MLKQKFYILQNINYWLCSLYNYLKNIYVNSILYLNSTKIILNFSHITLILTLTYLLNFLLIHILILIIISGVIVYTSNLYNKFYIHITIFVYMVYYWRYSSTTTNSMLNKIYSITLYINLQRVWSSIYIESVDMTNYNFGFSTHKSEILLHLSQWQYWWWFWFAFLWTIYLYITFRILNRRVIIFNPSLNTSLRSHGKWGDFLVAMIPLSWCGNILVNSNFILRMIEWQNEASLLTLRVMGKQWYWVYKFDMSEVSNLMNVPYNIGHNRWVETNTNESNSVNTYRTSLAAASYLEFYDQYRQALIKKNINKVGSSGRSLNCTSTIIDYVNSNENIHADYKKFEENFEANASTRVLDAIKPLNLVEGILNQKNIDTIRHYILRPEEEGKMKHFFFKLIFFNYVLNSTTEGFTVKDPYIEDIWGLRQKKYRRWSKVKFPIPEKYDPVTFEIKVPKPTEIVEYANYYKGLKVNKHRSETIPVVLARRLLRTKRTLVLPAHVNITVITNSYDVVHSWFIPGLGLKLDCVPGRSTHHSFYIDSIGFYYGQCAEICGRYHHHMPIRICALPFEHFIVWWQLKGLPRLNRAKTFRENHPIYNNKKLAILDYSLKVN